MKQRKKIVIANWKMNLTVPESTVLIEKLKKEIPGNVGSEVVLCPTFIDIYAAAEEVKGTKLLLGAQNVAEEEKGAYTGEVSVLALKGFVKYILAGHSERRNTFGENDKVVAKKTEIVVRHDMVPVICVGETLHEREDGLSKVVTLSQLEASCKHLTAEEISESVIAYEPVWAIGTGQVCDGQEAGKMAGDIRGLIHSLYGEKASEAVRILYGGSITAKSAKEMKKAKNIDGLLVGGASLDHKEFVAIVKNYGSKKQ
ncbi:MAG: triose-phosphate isomerase [Candidatus Schekmanbacteria bacterium RBG_16_38_10]|uniref:Triosephosphate isomerase n=1 Tax=Candidatus Schekmanbacteria bacterium RBG_16_38_10 TaxID=1817879 RepID=A0A1F7RQ39_9BACT|nr:MAG: triose-phosphate isomerase [Candidatus Schekmanbacteria bacterium RBG_16_38_10]